MINNLKTRCCCALQGLQQEIGGVTEDASPVETSSSTHEGYQRDGGNGCVDVFENRERVSNLKYKSPPACEGGKFNLSDCNPNGKVNLFPTPLISDPQPGPCLQKPFENSALAARDGSNSQAEGNIATVYCRNKYNHQTACADTNTKKSPCQSQNHFHESDKNISNQLIKPSLKCLNSVCDSKALIDDGELRVVSECAGHRLKISVLRGFDMPAAESGKSLWRENDHDRIEESNSNIDKGVRKKLDGSTIAINSNPSPENKNCRSASESKCEKTSTATSRHDRRRTLKKKFVKMGVIQDKPLVLETNIRASCECRFAEMASFFVRSSASLEERMRRIRILKCVRANARIAWNGLIEKEKGEKSLVLAALLSAELPRSIATPYDWINKESLLEDRDVVLAILKNDTSITVLDSRFSIPSSLRHDKEIILEYIRRRNGRLTMVHESLLHDRDVVLAAVSQNGQDLQYASESLRKDKQIVETACQGYGSSFRFSLGGARFQLGSDPVFMSKVIDSFKGGTMLAFASESIQNDPFFVSKALVNDFEFSKLPETQRTDRAFLMKLMEHDCAVYTKLPIPLKRNRCFAMLAILNCKDTQEAAEVCKQKAVIADVCQYANYILRDDTASRRLVSETPLTVTQDILRQGSRFINKNLVMLAVQRNAFLYGEHLQEPFRSDLDIIVAAITGESAGHVLRYVPRWTLLNNPKLVIIGIESCRKVDSHRDSLAAVGLLPWEIFRNRAVTAAWASAGFPLTPSFPADYSGDEEICLLFLKNLQNIWRYRLRKWIAGDLKGKKSFMAKACEYDASFFMEGVNGLSHDYDVLLTAASVDFDQVIRNMTEKNDQKALRQFCEKAQDRLCAREGFDVVAQGVIDQRRELSIGSPLVMLDQGNETREALLKLISRHLDLPSGGEFCRLDSIRFTVRQLLCTLPCM